MKSILTILIFLFAFIVKGQIQLEMQDASIAERDNPNVEVASLLVDTNINFKQSAHFNSIDNQYELSVNVSGAKGLNLYFDTFHIPLGGVLSLSSNNSDEIYSYDSSINPESGLFAIPQLDGNELLITYSGDLTNAQIIIGEVGCFFRSTNEISSSGFCEVDVNCEEGDEWQDQKRGVVRLLLKTTSSTVYCTGSLMNNTSRNCKPYIFSSEHCLDNVSASGLEQTIAYFNYEESSCGNNDATQNQTMVGMKLKASETFNNGSDFILLELNNPIPLEYNAYYNGWNSTNGSFGGGVSIHHPAGDVKKISTYSSTLVSPNINQLVSGAFWEVIWIETNNGHGVTEKGSSGSPIFNPQKLVVGNLSVGTSYCTKPSDPDYYGKVSYAWDGDSTESLSYWLDPADTGEENIPGSYFPCNDTAEQYLPIDSIVVLGYPATGYINLYVEQKNSSDVKVSVIGVSGQLIYSETLPASNIFNVKIPVSNLVNGVYVVVIDTSLGRKTINVVVLN